MTIESCLIRELSVVRLWFVNRMYVVCKIQVTSPFRRPLVSSMIRTRESCPCDKKGPMSGPTQKSHIFDKRNWKNAALLD